MLQRHFTLPCRLHLLTVPLTDYNCKTNRGVEVLFHISTEKVKEGKEMEEATTYSVSTVKLSGIESKQNTGLTTNQDPDKKIYR